MSLESMLFRAAPAAPSAPQPPAVPAMAGASPAGGRCAPGAGASVPESASPAAPPGKSAQDSPASRPARPETARSTGRKAGAEQSRAGSKAARAAGGPGSRPQAGEVSGSFSQALAQSQAASGHGIGAPHDAAHGHGPSSNSAAQTAGKPDPVGTALALVSRALPAVPSSGSGAGSGNAQAGAGTASLSATAKGVGRAAQALLAHAAAQDLKASGPAAGPTVTSPATASINAAAALSGAQAGLAARPAMPTHAAAGEAARLSAPVGTEGWAGELGARLTWMTHQGVQSATLQLSPEHLGPLQVSISVQHGEASVWFGAAHADTRQALEQAMPQLRQMLSGQGLTLTDSGVSRDAPREQAPRKGSAESVGAIAEESSGGPSSASPAQLGMVDAYA